LKDKTHKMKILHTVEYYYPSVGGAQEVVRQISERLVRKGHGVTVATKKLNGREFSSLNHVQIVEFAISGNTVRSINGDSKKYQDFLRTGKFDVMMNYAAQQWTADLAFPILEELPYKKVFVPCGFSALYRKEYADYFRKMPKWLRGYDQLVFASNDYRDIQFSQNHGIANYSIIPNGAGEDEFSNNTLDFREQYGIGDRFMILTVGSHTGKKGHSLVHRAFRKANLANAVLVVVGNIKGFRGCLWNCRMNKIMTSVMCGRQKKVLLLDPPREHVVSAYLATDLFVFGSNIEYSPLVIFEAMASKTPFISTNCGNVEEIIGWGGGGLVIETKRQSDGLVEGSLKDTVSKIEHLYNSEEERQRLTISGYKAWRNQFIWEKITDQYEKLYLQLITR